MWPLGWLLLFAACLSAQGPERVLTFGDDFNGPEPDLAKWALHDPWESLGRPADTILLSGGQLHIRNGVMTTFGTFAQMYGRFEIRCRISPGPGPKAAFRLMPVPLAHLPRIDVFESGENEASKLSFANFWGNEQTERSFGDSFAGPDLSTAFHVIAIDWDSGKILWSIDGKERLRSSEGIPQQPMYLVIEMNGGKLDVDYVRVYRRP